MSATQGPQNVRSLILAGLLTWAAVSAILMLGLAPRAPLSAAVLMAMLLLYIASFLLVTLHDHVSAKRPRLQLLLWPALIAQPLVVVLSQGFTADSSAYILLIIWCAQIAFFFDLRRTLLLVAGILLLANVLRWQVHGVVPHWLQPVLYFMFCVFAVLMARSIAAAEAANATLAQRNAELLATQKLLAINAGEHERLRIARDLHDTLGHHLTALSLQLEIAQHTGSEPQREALNQARQLTRLLLADVRATVGNLRQHFSLDVRELLQPVIEHVPRLQITLDVATDLQLADSSEAETVLRATQEVISNCLRHGHARHLHVQLQRRDGCVVMSARDDGVCRSPITPGNGLRGLQERVAQLGGQAEFGCHENGGFFVCLRWPQAQ